jgi:hypothetical protein
MDIPAQWYDPGKFQIIIYDLVQDHFYPLSIREASGLLNNTNQKDYSSLKPEVVF